MLKKQTESCASSKTFLFGAGVLTSIWAILGPLKRLAATHYEKKNHRSPPGISSDLLFALLRRVKGADAGQKRLVARGAASARGGMLWEENLDEPNEDLTIGYRCVFDSH